MYCKYCAFPGIGVGVAALAGGLPARWTFLVRPNTLFNRFLILKAIVPTTPSGCGVTAMRSPLLPSYSHALYLSLSCFLSSRMCSQQCRGSAPTSTAPPPASMPSAPPWSVMQARSPPGSALQRQRASSRRGGALSWITWGRDSMSGRLHWRARTGSWRKHGGEWLGGFVVCMLVSLGLVCIIAVFSLG